MRKIVFSSILAIAVIAISCNSVNSKKEKIANIEKEISSSKMTKFDDAKAEKLIALYTDFVKENPKDTIAPTYLFRSADLYVALNRGNMAINQLDKIITGYPTYKKIPDCYFLKAFIAENTLHHLSLADKFYKTFLEEFPTHSLAKDAEASRNNLGKSPEQLIVEFEAKQDSISKLELKK